MKVDRVHNITAFTISDIDGLDTILVIFKEPKLGTGTAIIECYGKCWSSYWGAMGNHDLRKFILSCDMGYLLNNFIPRGLSKKDQKYESEYLTRILTAVKEALEGVIYA